MSDDEESFVVLGSTPTHSMDDWKNSKPPESVKNISGVQIDFSVEPKSCESNKPISHVQINESIPIQNITTDQANNEKILDNSLEKSMDANMHDLDSKIDNTINSIKKSRIDGSSNSLAASFLLGKVESSVLKASIMAQISNCKSLETSLDDIAKLQNILKEHEDLKQNLKNTNVMMKELLTHVQRHRNENILLKQEYEKKLKEVEEIEHLRKEICDLKAANSIGVASGQEDDANVKSTEGKKETKLVHSSYDMIQSLSELDISLNENQIRQMMAEINESKEMRKLYIDEINCLKVNLTSAEELLKVKQNELNIIVQNKDDVKKEYEEYRKQSEDEITHLRAQLDVYKKDFDIERSANEELKRSNNELSTDIRLLQQRNQELLVMVEKRLGAVPKKEFSLVASPSTSPFSSLSIPSETFVCPLCKATFTDLGKLQRHVEMCLDKT